MPVLNRPSPATLDADRAATLALQDLTDYAPRNQAYSAETLRQLDAQLDQAEQAEARARRVYDLAREQATTAACALHSAVIGARAEVIAQYGSESPAVNAVGLKRKSEHKRPMRRRTSQPA